VPDDVEIDAYLAAIHNSERVDYLMMQRGIFTTNVQFLNSDQTSASKFLNTPTRLKKNVNVIVTVFSVIGLLTLIGLVSVQLKKQINKGS
jgi:hypothetical protein